MTEIRIHRELNAPIGDVWRSLTDPDELASWFWPQRFGAECRVDLRVGGTYRIDGVAAGMAVSGEYVAVDEPTSLSFTWAWDGDDEQTLVTISLAPTDAGTTLDLLHERFSSASTAADHEQGWNDCLDRLSSAVRA